MTIAQLYDYLDRKIAPFSLAEGFDNCGLLVGDPQRELTTVLLALDVTSGVLQEAAALGAQLILTHHPVIFTGLKALPADSLVYRLAKQDIAVLSMHTNLDSATGGVNDTLATLLGLQQVEALTLPGAEHPLVRLGRLQQPLSPQEFAAFVEQRLSPRGGLRWLAGNRAIKRVALCGGSGGSFIEAVAPLADAYLTGELRHHEALLAKEFSLTVLDAGHFDTEQVVLPPLSHKLSKKFPEISWHVSTEQAPLHLFSPL